MNELKVQKPRLDDVRTYSSHQDRITYIHKGIIRVETKPRTTNFQLLRYLTFQPLKIPIPPTRLSASILLISESPDVCDKTGRL